MNALTIQNPYPYLIMTPQEELPEGSFHKRVENRTWNTGVRGTIAIHAGVSMKWFKYGDYPLRSLKTPKVTDYPEMAFGAIVGTVELVDVFSIEQIITGNVPVGYEWLEEHTHVSGPYCFVLENPKRLVTPIPCKGALGFWNTSISLAEEIESQFKEVRA